MPNPIMFQEDAFVVLESNQPEQILSAEELVQKLIHTLNTMEHERPPELETIAQVEAQAQFLMETTCELNTGPGCYLQWYAVRLEK
ncbi:chlororespiratory reduction protein 7 [Leptolyngbya sp. AN02str]|uniref:chlororespiratory reduction protein 7 n=1 Tax=Leptolyngbya sp. AN02str TaxID=3423363 RepID=UPI003D31081A